jgi:hypothetical protein
LATLSTRAPRDNRSKRQTRILESRQYKWIYVTNYWPSGSKIGKELCAMMCRPFIPAARQLRTRWILASLPSSTTTHPFKSEWLTQDPTKDPRRPTGTKKAEWKADCLRAWGHKQLCSAAGCGPERRKCKIDWRSRWWWQRELGHIEAWATSITGQLKKNS